MKAALDQNYFADKTISRTDGVVGKKIGVFGKVFGCWHKSLTRPFTTEQGSYRGCLECGARRRFDEKSFKTFGAFYYPPAISQVAQKRQVI